MFNRWIVRYSFADNPHRHPIRVRIFNVADWGVALDYASEQMRDGATYAVVEKEFRI